MSLHEHNKAERRARILQAARRLIARRGYSRLNMRDLAEEARVSVPTVYNLIGSKQALLTALLETLIDGVASAQINLPHDASFVTRAAAMCEASQNAFLEMPDYARELVLSFLASDETQSVRHAMDEKSVQLMATLLELGRDGGELVPWADPRLVAGAMYMALVAATIRWAKREIDDDGLRLWIAAGTGLALLGVTRGRARHELEAMLQSLPPLPKEEHHGKKSA
jgi:AcrR family transcriptional regulator